MISKNEPYWPLVSDLPEPPGRDASGQREEDVRVLLLAPVRNDAVLTSRFLTDAGLATCICADISDLCRGIGEGCGAVLLAEEALANGNLEQLVEVLDSQPSWSDLPFILITRAGTAAAPASRLTALARTGNLMMIERPFRPNTIVSAVEVALRSRRRQYEVRSLLQEREALAAFALQKTHIFDTSLSSIADFVYMFDRQGRFLYANKPLLQLLGLDLQGVAGKTFAELPYPPLLAAKLQEQIEKVVETGTIIRDETPYIDPAGGEGFYEYIFSPVFGAGGEVDVVAGSTRDISERRKNEQALREADRRKDEFLAMLAHELRNPLASVASAAALLRETPDPPNLVWAAGVIERQSRQLAYLINDLLDVSRINTGKITLRREVLDAAALIDRACESALPMILGRRHRLMREYPVGKLWIHADPTRIEQIVLNLLTNAVKYTPEGGCIWISAEVEGSEVVIKVRDNGIGIHPERLPEMFHLFVQGERSIARSEGGLGIGLTIVQKLVELHGGRAGAHSLGPDTGSTFTVRLPVALPSGSGGQAERPEPAPRQKVILLVDDNVDSAQTLGRLLSRAGHRVTLAHTGSEALERAREDPPGIIVLDIGLPNMDGYTVARRLRSEPFPETPRIIALSGYGQPSDRAKAVTAGFDHYLVKPVDLKELKGLLA